MSRWLKKRSFSQLLEAECFWVKQITEALHPKDSLLMSSLDFYPLLDQLSSTYKTFLSPTSGTDDTQKIDYQTYPHLKERFNLVVLAHTLETSDAPQQMLDTSLSLLKGDGFLIVLGAYPGHFNRKRLDLPGETLQPIYPSSLKQMASRCTCINIKRFFSMINNDPRYRANATGENIGHLLPFLNQLYMVVLQKETPGLTPLKCRKPALSKKLNEALSTASCSLHQGNQKTS